VDGGAEYPGTSLLKMKICETIMAIIVRKSNTENATAAAKRGVDLTAGVTPDQIATTIKNSLQR
jgi:hypothetical protein